MAAGTVARPPIRGIVLGQQDIKTALVELATEQDMRHLAAGAEVNMATAMKRASQGELMELVGSPIYMRSRSGEFREVGFATSFQVRTSMLDVTSFGGAATFIPGLHEATLEFEGVLV